MSEIVFFLDWKSHLWFLCLESWGDLCRANDCQYGLRSSCFIADILSDVSDKIIRACYMSGATQAVAHDTSKAFDMIWHTSLIQRLDSYGIFDLVLFEDSFCIICYWWWWYYSILSTTNLSFMKSPVIRWGFSNYFYRKKWLQKNWSFSSYYQVSFHFSAMGLAWVDVVLSKLVLLCATWICCISYGNEYLCMLVLFFLLYFNPWLSRNAVNLNFIDNFLEDENDWTGSTLLFLRVHVCVGACPFLKKKKEKKSTKNFITPYSITFLSVFYKNVALHNLDSIWLLGAQKV